MRAHRRRKRQGRDFTPPRSLQEATGVQAVSNARSDIVIRKVKTQPIAASTSAGPDSDGTSLRRFLRRTSSAGEFSVVHSSFKS